MLDSDAGHYLGDRHQTSLFSKAARKEVSEILGLLKIGQTIFHCRYSEGLIHPIDVQGRNHHF